MTETTQALATIPAAQLPTLPSGAFWDRAKATSDLLTYGRGEKGFRVTLRARPTASDRLALAEGPNIAAAASERLKPGTADVRKTQLGMLLLHYPVRKFSEAQWNIWAESYHKLLAHVPDEVFVDACLKWLAEVPDRMPAPADLVRITNDILLHRRFWLAHCKSAADALANWDEEHQ